MDSLIGTQVQTHLGLPSVGEGSSCLQMGAGLIFAEHLSLVPEPFPRTVAEQKDHWKAGTSCEHHLR